MSEEKKSPIPNAAELEQQLKGAVDGVMEVSRLWARHGLEIGRTALETSAGTLRTAAETLKQVADRLGKPETK
ncbi:MAG: hypothetical protein JXB32_26140 [Deltaproteobacteria bacterium]|nr:hypothetical protein [Deltaproteobacteria bacterium]